MSRGFSKKYLFKSTFSLQPLDQPEESGTRPTFSFAKEKVGKKKATLKITI
jgi:hypothetical protein